MVYMTSGLIWVKEYVVNVYSKKIFILFYMTMKQIGQSWIRKYTSR